MQPMELMIFTYRGHSRSVSAVAWSPEGERIISGSQDGTVQMLEIAYAIPPLPFIRFLRRLRFGVLRGSCTKPTLPFIYHGHSDRVNAVAWSPDGKRIASGSTDGTVQVWDAVDGGHIFAYRGHTRDVYTVAWSPDSKRIASGSRDETVQVWNATNGDSVFIYRGHSGDVRAVAWSPDGQHIASGSWDGTVQMWSATDGSRVYTYLGHSNMVEAVAWSLDGKRIASGSRSLASSSRDGTIQSVECNRWRTSLHVSWTYWYSVCISVVAGWQAHHL